MKVKDILKFFLIESDDETNITHVSDHSSCKLDKWIYFNLSSKKNAISYINKARENHPYLIISLYQIEGCIYVENLKQKLNQFLIYFYHLKLNFKIIGITGTNGKSSLSNFLKQSLLLKGYRVKNITTSRENDGYKCENTTPDSFRLIEIFKKANRQKLDFLIMEVSSIGIIEGRVNNVNFDYLFLTNLTKDHLSFHKDIESYHQVKLNFIKQCHKTVYIDELVNHPLLKDFKYINVKRKIEFKNNKYQLYIKGKKILSPLLFKTNLINLSYCYYFLKDLNTSKKEISNILKQIKPYKGRLDVVSKNPLIVIDYAHTSSSFENVICECKFLFKRDLIIIFGCGGERDIEKRKEYPLIARKYKAYCIITEDNPRSENLELINKEIAKHLQNYEIISSRKEAIKRGINLLNNQSMLLILGKGNEDFIIMDHYKIYHNDYIEVEKCLQKVI